MSELKEKEVFLMGKIVKAMGSVLIAFALLMLSPMQLYAKETYEISSKEKVLFEFTDDEFMQAATEQYYEGNLSREDYQYVCNAFNGHKKNPGLLRLGAKGVNKVVTVGNNLYDYYLNNVVWGAISGLGTAAVGIIVGAIPGINATAAGVIGAIAGGAVGQIMSADNGVIIRMRRIPQWDGSSAWQFVSIRPQ